jgi:type II secretion system protein I
VRRRGSAGFTLLEVLVALAVLSFAVVAAIQGFAQGLRLLKLSGDHQAAMLLADEKARELVAPEEAQEEGTEEPFTWRRRVTPVEAPDLAPAGTPAAWKVFRIDVEVRWGESRQIAVATLRTVPAATPASATATDPARDPRR